MFIGDDKFAFIVFLDLESDGKERKSIIESCEEDLGCQIRKRNAGESQHLQKIDRIEIQFLGILQGERCLRLEENRAVFQDDRLEFLIREDLILASFVGQREEIGRLSFQVGKNIEASLGREILCELFQKEFWSLQKKGII